MKIDNNFAVRKSIVKACVETAQKLYGSGKSIRVLHLWVYDPNYSVAIDDMDLVREELKREFKEHLIRPLYESSIEVHPGLPGADVSFGVLIPGAVAYSYDYVPSSVRQGVAPVRARLTLVNPDKPVRGSFELDSSEKTDYHIGRVPTAHDNEGRFRENDIVIDDERISRAQADLYFRGGRLYLRPTSTGYRPFGNPTRVHTPRSKEPVELCDEFRGYPVCHGDIIELGGSRGVLYKVTFE